MPSPVRGAGFLSMLSLPRVAASFWRTPDAAAFMQWCDEGLEIAEIRLDMAQTTDDAEARALVAGVAALPTILTIRPHWEGGQWRGEEPARRDLFLRLLPQVAAVDIELAAEIRPQIIAAAKQCGTAVVVSRHNFAAADSPKEIAEAATRAFAEGADVFKNACMIEDEKALNGLEIFLQKWQHGPVIIIGMGLSEFARRARMELPARGSRLAFAAADEISAPGQPPLADMAAAVRQARAKPE